MSRRFAYVIVHLSHVHDFWSLKKVAHLKMKDLLNYIATKGTLKVVNKCWQNGLFDKML